MSAPELRVDRNRCDLYANCVQQAPDLFRLDDTDEDLVILSTRVPGEHLDAARKAVAACPKSALRLESG